WNTASHQGHWSSNFPCSRNVRVNRKHVRTNAQKRCYSIYLLGRKQLTGRDQVARPTTSSPPHEEVPGARQALEPQETGPCRSTRIYRPRHCPIC
ncbi:hypothetical protein M513_07264, partial [Trichuris suis]